MSPEDLWAKAITELLVVEGQARDSARPDLLAAVQDASACISELHRRGVQGNLF